MAYMEAGLGKLGLMPDVFWRCTPHEIDAMFYGRHGRPEARIMTPGKLNAMIERDQKREADRAAKRATALRLKNKT